MNLINKTELKRRFKVFLYFISPFRKIKCVNCRYENKCNFKKCNFKEKIYVQLNNEWVETNSSFADIFYDINGRLR